MALRNILASHRGQSLSKSYLGTPPLEVQTLGDVALLPVQRLLLGLDEVLLTDLHPALPQRQHPGLGADGLDVGPAQVVLAHDELLEVDVLGQCHLGRVDVEDVPLGLDVRQREFDLAIDPAGADEGGVETFDLVGGHDDLDVASLVESIELVEQLEHGPLDLAGAARGGVVPLGADGVDLVDEDDGRGQVVGDAEHLPNELGAVSEVLLDELGTDDAEEGGAGLVGDGLGEEGLAGAGLAVQDDSLGGFDANVLVQLGVGQGQLDGLLDLLDLVLQPADVGVGFQRRLLDLHDGDHGVGVVGEYADDGHGLVVKEDGGAGLEEVLVDAGQDVDVVLRPDAAGHDGVVVVDELLERPDGEGGAAELLELLPLLLVALLVRLEHLVVADELLLQEEKVLDALQLQEPELALGVGDDGRGLAEAGGALAAAAAAGPGGRPGLEALLLLLVLVGPVLLAVGVAPGASRGVHPPWHLVTHDDW